MKNEKEITYYSWLSFGLMKMKNKIENEDFEIKNDEISIKSRNFVGKKINKKVWIFFRYFFSIILAIILFRAWNWVDSMPSPIPAAIINAYVLNLMFFKIKIFGFRLIITNILLMISLIISVYSIFVFSGLFLGFMGLFLLIPFCLGWYFIFFAMRDYGYSRNYDYYAIKNKYLIVRVEK